MNKHVPREWYKLCIFFDDKLNQMQDGPAKQFIPNLNSFPMSEKISLCRIFSREMSIHMSSCHAYKRKQ